MNIELVIFDMDGLMFDTERISYRSWKESAAKFGYDVTMELFKMTLGTNLETTKSIYIKHFGNDCPIDIIAKKRFAISEELIEAEGVPVKYGLSDLIGYLNSSNLKKAVATSTSKERANKLISMAGISSHFDYIICGDEIEKSKPEPEIFLKVAKRLGCLPEKCLVLEDSQVGILAAFRAGMKPVMVPDIVEPSEEIRKIIFKEVTNLFDVIDVIKEANN